MSDTAVMTLTEFLTARFDEDEAEAGKMLGPVGDQAPASLLGLAEVAAKRRLIETVTYYANHLGESDLLNDALRDIASVYADHPDYDPAWT